MTLVSTARVRLVAVGLALALVGAVGAPAASAVESDAPAPAGPVPKGAGLLSAAALAQESCAANGRTNYYYASAGPFCVNPWNDGDDNGGTTAPGVTATTVTVVGYFSNDAMMAETGEVQPKNDVTGAPATWDQAAADNEAAFAALTEQLGTFQLWGRTPDIEVVLASGADEASQRADALAVIDKKPFMVFDMASSSEGGSPVFSSVIAAEKIIVWSASTTPEIAAAQSPYRWNYGQDPDSIPALAAAFVGRTLSAKTARSAGSAARSPRTREFGGE
jgi:hypothetical protein